MMYSNQKPLGNNVITNEDMINYLIKTNDTNYIYFKETINLSNFGYVMDFEYIEKCRMIKGIIE